jgi:hypothetical protein
LVFFFLPLFFAFVERPQTIEPPAVPTATTTVRATSVMTDTAPAAPTTATLSIITSPAGAIVSEDGRILGITPLILNGFALGHHQFLLRHPGFADTTIARTVTASRETANIDAAWPAGGLQILSQPSDALVFDQGTVVGTTPLQLEDLPAGIHHFALVKAGYLPLRRDYRIEAGTESNWSGQLTLLSAPVPKTAPVRPSPPPIFSRGSVLARLRTSSNTLDLTNHAESAIRVGFVLVQLKRSGRSVKVSVDKLLAPGATISVRLREYLQNGDILSISTTPLLPAGSIAFSSN